MIADPFAGVAGQRSYTETGAVRGDVTNDGRAASVLSRHIEPVGRGMAAVKRDHAALLAAAGFDRFLLDRVGLDDEAPLRCEMKRVGAALGRVAEWIGQGE